MNFKIVSIPKFVAGILLLILAPILAGLFLVHADLSEKQVAPDKRKMAKVRSYMVTFVCITACGIGDSC